ncbi:MAG: hypothetical protein ACREEO_03175, partial [Phenylobacterium sp.]
MDEPVSDRLLDQRLRNRMIEELLCLTDWEATLAWGAEEYFNSFFHVFPDEPPLRPNSALTEGERAALAAVLSLISAAANGTLRQVTKAELIASGWPARIRPAAQEAVALMLARGKFSDEVEE